MSTAASWDALRSRHAPAVVDKLHSHFVKGPFTIDAEDLASEAGVSSDGALECLVDAAAINLLKQERKWFCPCAERRELDLETVTRDVCLKCNKAFVEDVGGVPAEELVFVSDAPPTRDVRWLLALHGMNTRGAWQESLVWRVSRAYGYTVPIAIYKYGVIRPGVIIKLRQRQLLRQLVDRITRLVGDADKSGFGGRPDVIAHSFGSWLIGHALLNDSDLKIGRVVLAGSILRPDFPWTMLIERGQVEAVFCYRATADIPVWWAHYFIPDSGPSGRTGFGDDAVVEFSAPGASHSSCFSDKEFDGVLNDVWLPFLTAPAAEPQTLRSNRPQWRQSRWPFRATLLRWLLLLLVLTVVAAVSLSLGFGAVRLVKLF